MRQNLEDLPRTRRYDLFREMHKRTNESGKESFTAWSLRYSMEGFSRNPGVLRRDLESLAEEGLVFKGTKVMKIATYKPDDPNSSIPAGVFAHGSLRGRLYDLICLRQLVRDNTHFECQWCGKLFASAKTLLGPFFPWCLCPHCLRQSRLSLATRRHLRIMTGQHEDNQSLGQLLDEPKCQSA